MLYDKACAVTLLNRIKENGTLDIENQYTKSDFIFYKFKNSNVAVTKKLNHLDLSILSEEDLNYLLTTVTNDYIQNNKEDIEASAMEYYLLINKWNREKSMVSKMYDFVNHSLLNDSSIVESENTLISNNAILELLMNNKAVLVKNNSNNRRLNDEGQIILDVTIERNLTRNHRNTTDGIKLELVVEPTDNNINIFGSLVREELGTDNEQNSIFVNKVNLYLGILINKYNRNREDQAFLSHKKNIYRIRSNAQVNNDLSDENFMKNYKKALSNVLYSPSSSFMQVLTGGYYYYSIWELRRNIGTDPAVLDIDYSAMSDEHLTAFKDSVTWLINRHAKYIGVNEKDRESYCMFLGSNNLKGKKLTKEVLTRHLNLSNMDLEIQRRERER